MELDKNLTDPEDLASRGDRRILGIIKFLVEGADTVPPDDEPKAAPAAEINDYLNENRSGMRYWYGEAISEQVVKKIDRTVDEKGSNVYQLTDRGQEVYDAEDTRATYSGDVSIGEAKELAEDAHSVASELKLAVRGHGQTLDSYDDRIDGLGESTEENAEEIRKLRDRMARTENRLDDLEETVNEVESVAYDVVDMLEEVTSSRA
jgi:hypothetical protein